MEHYSSVFRCNSITLSLSWSVDGGFLRWTNERKRQLITIHRFMCSEMWFCCWKAQQWKQANALVVGLGETVNCCMSLAQLFPKENKSDASAVCVQCLQMCWNIAGWSCEFCWVGIRGGSLKNSIFWDIRLCNLLKVCRRLRETKEGHGIHRDSRYEGQDLNNQIRCRNASDWTLIFNHT
jgi:hypothetical protein